MAHSSIVGGSTAKRVMACPGSVKLAQTVPPRPAGPYADEGTLLHNAMAEMLQQDKDLNHVIDMTYNGQVMSSERLDKLQFALNALNDIDPAATMRMAVEEVVSFGDLLPGVFGSCDVMGRVGDKVVVLDWKFGDGVAVEAEENPQLMFYAAAAMRTPSLEWVFKDATELELVIVQPPSIKRWTTTFDRIRQFERELVYAVKLATRIDAPLKSGEHCRFCPAKAVCPEQTGQLARVLKVQIENLPAEQIGQWLKDADRVESFITDLRALALQILESGGNVPGYKLVAKRGVRKWVDEKQAQTALLSQLPEDEVMERSLISPAQAEKKLKKIKGTLPEVVSVSSGNTLAEESDPRPAVLLIGSQLSAALGKLV